MATDQVPQTYQDSLDNLSKIADANGNRFRIKVVRRPNAASSISQHVATFGDATWQHIADAESWLEPFSGGGLYILQIFDGADGRKQHGQITPSEITGPPRPPNPKICASAAWIGPVLISSAANGTISGGAGAVALSSSSLGGGSYFGDLPRSGSDAGLASLFQAERSGLNRKAEDLAKAEHRAELEALRREAAENAKRMEQRILDMTEKLRAPPPPPPPPLDIVGLVAALGAVAGPIIAAMGSAAAEGRRAASELEARRMEREAARLEAERLDREHRAAREAEDRKSASSRPLIDPQILEIMDRQAKRAEEQASQFSLFLKAQAEAGRANMESQSVAQRTMLQTIADVAQLQLKVGGGEESPGIDWTKVISGVAAGLGALAQAKAGGPGGAPPGMGGASAGLPGGPAAPAPDVPASPLLDEIEDRIRSKAPPDQVIADLKKVLDDPGVKAEIEAEGGLENVFSERLSDFAEEKSNEKYLGALQTALISSGVFG